MNLQVRFGIIGAALGLLIGLIGGIAGGVPFGIVLLRTLVTALLAGAAGFALSFVIKQFLPELFPESGAATAESSEGPETGSRVDITVDGDEGDQAQALRDEMEQQRSMFEDPEAEGQDPGIMEEVSENPGRAAASARFDEDAFYQGVEQLPDIGGFSEQFQSDDQAAATDAAVDTPSMRMDSSSSRSEGPGSNLDPALVAQAIRTALKKEDS